PCVSSWRTAVTLHGARRLDGASVGVDLTSGSSEGGSVMKKILSLALVVVLSLALAAPVSAGRGSGGGFHGGVFGGGPGGVHDRFPPIWWCFSRRVSRWVPWWIPSRLPSVRLLFPPRLRRWSRSRAGARVSGLWLSLRGVPCLHGPNLRTCAGLPDAGPRGPISPAGAGDLLSQRLLLPARQWGDGRLFVDMGASRAHSTPSFADS